MPPNTTTSTETVSEQFKKLDLKQLVREKRLYQVYPQVSVSIWNIINILTTTILISYIQ